MKTSVSKESNMVKKAMTQLGALLAVLSVPVSAFAQGAAHAASGGNDPKIYAFIAAGLAIGVAAFGGAMGQGKASAAALDGIARNPGAADKMFVPMILALALIESLVIYALVIAFQILGAVK